MSTRHHMPASAKTWECVRKELRAGTRTLTRFILLSLAVVSAGCAFNMPLTLNAPMDLPAAVTFRIHTLKVAAPPAGANVFVFEDFSTYMPAAVASPGGISFSGTSGGGGIKRADFTYTLANDSGPTFSTALKNLFKEDPGSSVDAQVVADFNYRLMKRREGVNLFGSGNTNTIGLNMVVRLVLTSNGQVVLEKNYTASESDSYPTAWVTIPSRDFLDALFRQALRRISSQIAGDSEIAKYL